MDIKNLSYIIEAYKCHSVNKAAQNVFISQSHLSGIIKNVEQEIGYSIFIRTPSGLTATHQGQYFLESAEKIVKNWETILNIPIYSQDSESLSIYTTPSSFTFHSYLKYKQKYPSGGSDTFLESGLKETIKGIVNQQCRIGILMLLEHQIEKYHHIAESYKLDFVVLKKGIHMRVYMSEHHPLAMSKYVTKAELKQYPIVTDINLDIDDRIHFTDNTTQILYVSDRGTSYDAMHKGNYLLAGLINPGDLVSLESTSKLIIDGDKLAFCFIKPHLFELNYQEEKFISFFSEEIKNSFEN